MVVARDLQAFMMFKQERIQELIDQKLSAGPQNVPFSAELQFFKHFREPDEDDERITIFANSLMTPVHAEGLSNADFSSMVEKMLAVLFTFASSGSGCLLEKVLRVKIKFTKYRPASGSSYIDLPPHLQKCNSLLNIRNHTDNNCFLYSFVAASYLKSNIFEGEEGQNDSLKLTSTEFYQNMSSLQPAGEFTMPTGFNDINKFETLKDVEVNVLDLKNEICFQCGCLKGQLPN